MTARQDPLSQPAEWEKHTQCWLAWPHLEAEWGNPFEEARREFLSLCRAIVAADEPICILVPSEDEQTHVRKQLGSVPAQILVRPYGDIWLRDTGPTFVFGGKDGLSAVRYHFNGWGNKYLYEHDDRVATVIAETADVPVRPVDLHAEGGAIDVDGRGVALTTEQCLLNPNRNPNMSKEQIEEQLSQCLGTEKIIWLKRGLHNDHTDGHVDTLARFVAPGHVVCMETDDPDDPNHDTLCQIEIDLRAASDAHDRPLTVTTVPSPGRIQGPDDEVLPASYMNFYIANQTVIVPTYGSSHDDSAVAALGALFPSRKSVGLPARAILTGGGAFHCITQQEPARK